MNSEIAAAPGTPLRRPGDAFDGQLPERLPKALVQELSRVNIWVQLAHIALEWTAIGVAIAMCEHFWNPLLYLVCVAFLAGRQHALIVLMHEGIHYRIASNKRLNDFIAELFCAWPVFLPMRGSRRHHFAHHRHMNTDADPDFVRKKSDAWKFPQRKTKLFRMLILDAVGVNFWLILLMFAEVSRWEKHADPVARRKERVFQLTRIAFYPSMILLLWKLNALRLLGLYWIVPLFTWLVMIMHIRSIAEHFAVERDHFYSHTRTVVPTLWNRVFLIPKNICYHIEHHLYPTVPFFRLPKLHEVLKQDPVYRAHAHVTYSYWAAIKEMCGTPRARRPWQSTDVHAGTQ